VISAAPAVITTPARRRTAAETGAVTVPTPVPGRFPAAATTLGLRGERHHGACQQRCPHDLLHRAAEPGARARESAGEQ
jgi:hypothetical protein